MGIDLQCPSSAADSCSIRCSELDETHCKINVAVPDFYAYEYLNLSIANKPSTPLFVGVLYFECTSGIKNQSATMLFYDTLSDTYLCAHNGANACCPFGQCEGDVGEQNGMHFDSELMSLTMFFDDLDSIDVIIANAANDLLSQTTAINSYGDTLMQCTDIIACMLSTINQ